MKKAILAVLMVFLILGLSAEIRTIYTAKTSSLRSSEGPEKLYNTIQNIANNGGDIYYYNDKYVVMGKLPQDQNLFIRDEIISFDLTGDARLYLVSKIPGDDKFLLSKPDILLDLGESLLIESSETDIQLRSRISNPFVEIDFTPMKFSLVNTISDSYRSTRTTIEQLTAQVNADSVQSFIQHLQDFQTRYALADNRLAVATWIKNQFIRMGITNTQLKPFQWQNTTQYNVEATITGSVSPNEYIIVGGHHDSILSSGDATIFAPGADDNASGTVAALEMARVMTLMNYQPQCSIRFVTFAAEEFGLWGGKSYAATADDQDMSIRVMMNHDMIAYSTQSPSEWLVRLMPYDGSLEQSQFAAQLTSQYTTLNPVYGSMNSSGSDSYPFWQHGFKVIYFFENTFTPNYHSVLDLVANLNPVYCAEVIRASVACAVGFANMPSAPVNLTVADVGNGNQLQVNWQAPPDQAVDHYNVYMGFNPTEMGTPVQVTSTSYTMSGLTEGVLYYIQVSAVDALGNESYRPVVSCTPRSIPLTPAGFQQTPIFGAIRLDWIYNTELDLAGYRLFKSMDPGQIGDSVSQNLLTNNVLTDTDVTGGGGYYYYTLLAVDTSGNVSPYTETISSRPITLNQGILIVDETKNMNGTSPLQPNDLQVDSYYMSFMEGYEVGNFDTEANEDYLRLADMGPYNIVLWHGNESSDVTYPYYVQDAIRNYLAAGGNILFTIYQPSQAFNLNSSYPVTFAENTFCNSVLGIAGADHSTSTRFRYANSLVDGYPNLAVDPDKTLASLNNHIIRIEGLTTAPGATNLYSYGSDYENSSPQGSLNGMSVGILKQTSGGKVVTLSFPLYNMIQSQTANLLTHVFSDVFEYPAASDDPEDVTSPSLVLHPATPNPFSGETRISLDLKDTTRDLAIRVYNLKGQMVKTIYQGIPQDKHAAYIWDGLDAHGKQVRSGLYIIKASQGASVSTVKSVLLK